MALFLMDHSVEKIMILGRCSSNAFMVYIRPQVLEWTNIMAQDMAKAGSFHDLNASKDATTTTSGQRNNPRPQDIPPILPREMILWLESEVEVKNKSHPGNQVRPILATL